MSNKLNQHLLEIAEYSKNNQRCGTEGGCKLDLLIGGPKVSQSGGSEEINKELLEKQKSYPYNALGVQDTDWMKQYDSSTSNSYKIGLQYVKVPRIQYDTYHQYLPFRFDSFSHALEHANKYFPDLQFKINGSSDAPHFYNSNYIGQNAKYSDLVKKYSEQQNNKQDGGALEQSEDSGDEILGMDIDDLQKVLDNQKIAQLYEAERRVKKIKKKQMNEEKNKKDFVEQVMNGGYTDNNKLLDENKIPYKVNQEDNVKLANIEYFINNFKSKYNKRKNLKVKKL
jgi:hypothetical protein